MQKCSLKSIVLCLVLCLGLYGAGNAVKNEPPNPFRFKNNALYYLEQWRPILRAFVAQVRAQSIEENYPFYSYRPMIEYSVYRDLGRDKRLTLRGGIVLVQAYIDKFIRYSNFGGVGIGAKLSPNDTSTFYLNFDGRYLSDLELFDIGAEIFAYCVLPRLDKCIMLGIGEEWDSNFYAQDKIERMFKYRF